ncbi:hypothetical protein FACS1894176_08840 [Bacteroidia bacterium]|nr:hypothetical protein FACS1894176_08840 [Bacteroidia bacterium]
MPIRRATKSDIRGKGASSEDAGFVITSPHQQMGGIIYIHKSEPITLFPDVLNIPVNPYLLKLDKYKRNMQKVKF